jgi:hypothetical protein
LLPGISRGGLCSSGGDAAAGYVAIRSEPSYNRLKSDYAVNRL